MIVIAAHCGTHPIGLQRSYLDSYHNYNKSLHCSRCSFSACTVVHSRVFPPLLWEWNYDNIIAQYKSQLILYQYMHNTVYCFGGYRIVFCCALEAAQGICTLAQIYVKIINFFYKGKEP